ncbi:DoxX family protein, partial [Rhodococcus oxybenzonivorans]|nr:DoxX family protein [Rhodococcus oxybenzonivorans]
AVLLTGYLGGAVATNMLTEQPLFSTILFPVYVGIFVWGGLWLRDAGVRTIMPIRR